MADVSESITIAATGADEASAAINQVSQGFENLGAEHNKLSGLFGQKIQHIGLMLFARDALTANGLGAESRMMINLLNSALMAGASVFGVAGQAILPLVIGMGALAAVISLVMSKHQESLPDLEKQIAANDALDQSYRTNISTIDNYVAAGGKMTTFLQEYRDAQVAAQKATNDATIAIEKQAIEAIQANIDKINDQIRAQQNLNDSAQRTIQTGGNVMAGTYALADAYSQLGKDEIPKLKSQVDTLNATLEQHRAKIQAIKDGYPDMNKELEAATDELNKQNQANLALVSSYGDTYAQMKKELDDWNAANTKAWNESTKVVKQSVGTMENSFASNFQQMIRGTESWRDALKNIFNDILNDFIRMVGKMIAEWLMFEALTGMGMSITHASGLTGFIPFGGGQAEGGDYMVDSPTLFMAGEAGPEMASFTPLSKMQSSGGTSQSGGKTVAIGTIQTNIYGITDPSEIADQVGLQIVQRIRGMGEIDFVRTS